MAQRIKQIQVGIIKSEKEAKEVIQKIKLILAQALQEINQTNESEIAPASLADNVAKVVTFVLDKATEVTNTEEAKKVLNEITKDTGYSEKQIRSILDTVKKSLNSLI